MTINVQIGIFLSGIKNLFIAKFDMRKFCVHYVTVQIYPALSISAQRLLPFMRHSSDGG